MKFHFRIRLPYRRASHDACLMNAYSWCKVAPEQWLILNQNLIVNAGQGVGTVEPSRCAKQVSALLGIMNFIGRVVSSFSFLPLPR